MIRTFYLHAGPPKTGTTAIQLFCRDNAQNLARQGVYWPRSGTERRGFNHLSLSDAFRPLHDGRQLLAALERELAENNYPGRVIVSAEHFAERLSDPAYLATLERFTGKIGYRLHVIAYVRPQPALLNSLYAQNVKNWRLVPEMIRYIEREVRGNRHDYLKKFGPLLGNENCDLTLRPFNRETLRHGIQHDFCGVIGISGSDGPPFVVGPDVNVSPGPKTVAALRQIRNRSLKLFPGANKEALAGLTAPLLGKAQALGWNSEKFGGISPDAQAALSLHFQETNDQLARRVWSRPWAEVFSQADNAPPPYNVFDPRQAPPSERRVYRDFLANSMDTVRDLMGQ